MLTGGMHRRFWAGSSIRAVDHAAWGRPPRASACSWIPVDDPGDVWVVLGVDQF